MFYNKRSSRRICWAIQLYRKKTEKYVSISVIIEKKVTKIDKNEEKITKTISCRLQFTDSERFMASSLSNSVDNLVEETHKVKCTNCNTYCLEYTKDKDNSIG